MATFDKQHVLKLVLTGTLGAFLGGYQIGVFNPCQDNVAYWLEWEGSTKSAMISVCSTLMPLGAVIGSFLAGKYSRFAGRRKALIVNALLSIVSSGIVIPP
jgi:MFS family permease